ncbi:MAG: hypothetical protein K2K80_06180, partial [Clostridia bacterium]|nr:hypothetical protein [Clostridia bacterium]
MGMRILGFCFAANTLGAVFLVINVRAFRIGLLGIALVSRGITNLPVIICVGIYVYPMVFMRRRSGFFLAANALITCLVIFVVSLRGSGVNFVALVSVSLALSSAERRSLPTDNRGRVRWVCRRYKP